MITRVQVGISEEVTAADSTPAQPHESIKVHQGTVRYGAGQESASVSGVTRHVVTFGGAPGGSVAETLRTINGQQTVELIPGNAASRTVVHAAAREGLIRRNAAGQWEDVANQQATVEALKQMDSVPPAQTPELSPEDAAVFDQQTEAEWNALIEPIPQAAYDHAVAATIAHLVHGSDLDNIAHRFAEASGIEPAEAIDYLNAGYTHYGSQVIRALAPLGIEGERMNAFVDDLARDRNRYHDAIQRLVYMRDLSGFREAAAAFNRRHPMAGA